MQCPPRRDTIDRFDDLASNQQPWQDYGDAECRQAAGAHRQRTRGRFRFRLRCVILLVALILANLNVATEVDARGAALRMRAVPTQQQGRALSLQLPAGLLHQHLRHLAW